MSIIQQNFLQPIEFVFQIKRLPNVSFFVQQLTLPGTSVGFATQPTMFRNYYLPGDKMDMDNLDITFKIDENMASYLEIRDWIVGLSRPDEFAQYANLESGEGICSDATLHVLSNQSNPNIEIQFQDIFPVSISSVTLDTTSSDVTYPVATVSFKVNGMTINPL